jgi:hypothetical protein
MVQYVSGNGNRFYSYADAAGTVRILSNSSGNIKESYTYDPYGRPRVMRAGGPDGNWLTEDTAVYASSHPLLYGNPYLFTGRRRFVEVVAQFPDECLTVLQIIKAVYQNDADAKEQGLSDDERLLWHQTRSGPKMAELKLWMTEQIEQKKVEPNSGLGEAIGYMLRHWDELTLFLRQPGAPLDNNVCERALKRAILHRKNAYFYKTLNGAHVGDLFMSLIHTCELNKVNPFDYLVQLQKNAKPAASTPADWMPWNYHQALESTAAHK